MRTPPSPGLSRQARILRHKVLLTVGGLGIAYGYSEGAIGGALVLLRDDYHLSPVEISAVTVITLVGCVVGALAAPRVADRGGRKSAVVTVAAVLVIASTLCAIPINVAWLIVARFLLGVGVGASTVIVPVFISEFSPDHLRSKVGTSYQFFITAGILVAMGVGYVAARYDAWGPLLGLSFLPAAVGLIALKNIPDSPLWYATQDRHDEGMDALRHIEGDSDIGARYTLLTAEAEGNTGALRELFEKRHIRATAFVLGFGFLVQATGTNTVLYYSPLIFQEAGVSDAGDSILVTAPVHAASIVGVLLSMWAVDRWNRQWLLISGTTAMVVGHVLLVWVFLNGQSATSAALAVTGVALVRGGFSFGIGSLLWVYAGEALPGHLRSKGASMLLITNFTADLAASFTFPPILAAAGGVAGFGGFAVISLITLLFVYFLAPDSARSAAELRVAASGFDSRNSTATHTG